MAKKKDKEKLFTKEGVESVRSDLDELLNDETGSSNLKELQTKDESNEYVQTKDKEKIDFNEIRNSSYDEAKNLMNKLLKFYSKNDIITQNEYLNARKNIESQTLGSLIYQLRTAETMMTKLVEQIDNGVVDARMFEVLAESQKSLLEITRSVNIFINNIEQNMQLNINEIESREEQLSDEGNDNLESDDGKYRGTRDLMQQIQNEPIEDDNSDQNDSKNEDDDNKNFLDNLNDELNDDNE